MRNRPNPNETDPTIEELRRRRRPIFIPKRAFPVFPVPPALFWKAFDRFWNGPREEVPPITPEELGEYPGIDLAELEKTYNQAWIGKTKPRMVIFGDQLYIREGAD